MPFSINVLPKDSSKVEEIKARIYGEGKGNCIILNIGDDIIILHYGKSENRYEFVSKLKEVIAELPNGPNWRTYHIEPIICPTCGK